MPLVSNRPDSNTRVYQGRHITTYFEDVYLVPLPCWLFLLYTALFFFLIARGGGHERGKPAVDHDQHRPSRVRSIIQKAITALIIFFTFGALILTILELIRLTQINWGVGLLPFVPVTIFLATLFFLLRNRPPKAYTYRSKFAGSYRARVGACVYIYWVFQIAVLAVKLSTLIRLKHDYPRTGTVYETFHQINDVALTIGCLAVIFILAIIRMALEGPSR